MRIVKAATPAALLAGSTATALADQAERLLNRLILPGPAGSMTTAAGAELVSDGTMTMITTDAGAPAG